jgi:branched-chain amino acid transport system ATP-binding protein
MTMLDVEKIDTFYGQSQALRAVSLAVDKGEVVAILGRNGAGKTTTLRSIVGFNKPRRGTITYQGEDITTKEPYERVQRGLGYVPEDREVWGQLSVEENLQIPGGRGGDRTIEGVYEVFPKLGELSESHAEDLSGGEQQMLAIGRGLLGGTELLLLDEASEGLAPKIVENVRESLQELKNELTILMVEQNVDLALDLADRVYFIINGKIVHEATATELRDKPEIVERYVTVE